MRPRAGSGLFFQRMPGGSRGGGMPAGKPCPAPATFEKDEPVIVCRTCKAAITAPREAMDVAGAHLHTYANPHGIVFEIACFRTAPGCTHIGAPNVDFTWFSGYQWRIAICAACHEHLGWRYEAAGNDSFYGLIVDRLIFPA